MGGVAVDPQSGALPSLAWPRKTRRLRGPWGSLGVPRVPSLRRTLHSPAQEERRQPTKEVAQAVTQNHDLFKIGNKANVPTDYLQPSSLLFL